MKIIPFQLTNSTGDTVSILNYGARIHQWHVLVCGELRSIVLHYPELERYLNDSCYLGAIAGPYANRIRDARVNIADTEIMLDANEGNNTLHGGQNALDKQFWQKVSHTESELVLSTQLKNGHNGFPGDIVFVVRYLLTENELLIEMSATSEKTTIVGPTSHAYFNLSGHRSTVLAHQLMLNAERYTPLDNDNIPTGIIEPVFSTPLDFTKTQVLSKLDKHPLDHNFLINGNGQPCATLISPKGDLSLVVETDYPAMQIYDGKFLNSPLIENQGLCIEPQYPPNAPNEKDFPFEITSPEKPFNKFIRYRINRANAQL